MDNTNTRPIVALFGSARPQPTDPIYQEVERQAALLTDAGWQIATGGGPGLMEAANKAAVQHCTDGVCSLGYSIYLPFEATTNDHVQQDTHHDTFFTRLDQFCKCDAFIANPGGIGTLLEILMVAQLNQVDLMDKPLSLVGEAWKSIMDNAHDLLLRDGYISPGDNTCWTYAQTPVNAALELLSIQRSTER